MPCARLETLWRRRLCGLLAAALLFPAAGCASFLSEVMVSAPNRFNPFGSKTMLSPPERKLLGVDQQFRVDVGPPDASLAVSVIEPTNFAEPRGTILVLHGIWNRSIWMLGTAQMFA